MSFIGDITGKLEDVGKTALNAIGGIGKVIPGVSAAWDAARSVFGGGAVAVSPPGGGPVNYYSTQPPQTIPTQKAGYIAGLTRAGPMGLPNYVWLMGGAGLFYVFFIRKRGK